MNFPESSGVRVIAEPGRYFVESAFTLATSIIGYRSSSIVTHIDGRDDNMNGRVRLRPEFIVDP